MTNTVSFTDSSINLLLFLLLSLSSEVGDCNASIDALKPCFEEHTDQRLSNLLPYHSEWRMKTPGQCLLFCALSSSRCRSTVHDTFQHICYYFLHDGQEYARTARGMVYFRVNEKKCLDQFLNGSNLAFLDSEFAISGISSSTPKYDTSTSFTELQWPAVAHSNPLIHVPPGGRAITPTPYFDYFDNQQKFKKHEKFDESNPTIATSIMTTDKTVISASSITVSAFASWPIALSKVLSDGEDQRLRRICPTDTSFRIFVANLSNVLIHAQRRFALEQSTHETRSSDDALSFVGNIGNLPAVGANFGKNRQKDDVNLNKLLKATPEDVRQLMNAEKLDESTNETSLNAEKSIVDRLTPISAVKSISKSLSKRNGRTERLLPPAVVCESNEREVWLIVENAVLRTDQLQKKASAGSYKSCRAKCNLITISGRECTSFTYDEVKRQCVTHINNDAVVSSLHFLLSSESDFNILTAVKFCYPESLIILEQCSEFIAFLDYAINIEPREISDDIARDHHGLYRCIELCFSASHFHCKSAAFVVTLGKCLLYDEDPLSSPEYFQKHQQYGLIYFEIGCKQFDGKQSWINFCQDLNKP
ncbi:hypothetical protein LOAG_04610 [Loa loa]|uniref:Apple domain-containing protein n=1 Tax=Loa loa TaxID=7209 RepID=A0A1S0U290_LOALO|nr:hypothetical protein LOAG_04610 [Loa loa]EFO23874.2 hypothetical protein LOAG_04610 [Loa loa]